MWALVLLPRLPSEGPYQTQNVRERRDWTYRSLVPSALALRRPSREFPLDLQVQGEMGALDKE